MCLNLLSETEDAYKCSYESILKMLDLKKNSDKYVINRPVKDYRSKTWVYVQMRIYAILDMVRFYNYSSLEITQKFLLETGTGDIICNTYNFLLSLCCSNFH